jgi:hypothetical protein
MMADTMKIIENTVSCAIFLFFPCTYFRPMAGAQAARPRGVSPIWLLIGDDNSAGPVPRCNPRPLLVFGRGCSCEGEARPCVNATGGGFGAGRSVVHYPPFLPMSSRSSAYAYVSVHMGCSFSSVWKKAFRRKNPLGEIRFSPMISTMRHFGDCILP